MAVPNLCKPCRDLVGSDDGSIFVQIPFFMTLKELIKQVKWQDVAIALVSDHPWCRKSLEGYRKVFDTLYLMDSVDSEFCIKIELSPDILEPNRLYTDVVGIKEGVDERWGLSFSPWKEWLGMVVSKDSLDTYSASRIVANCIYEMTFHGFTEETINQEIQKLKDSIKESEEHPERLHKFDPEQMHIEISMKGYLRCLDRWLKWGALAKDYYGEDVSWFKTHFLNSKAPEYFDELDRQTLKAALKEIIWEIEDVIKSL